MSELDTTKNPLLARGALPRFDEIRIEHVEPAMRFLLDELGEEFDRLEPAISSRPPTWATVIEPVESIGDRLAYSWGIVGHLMGVQNSDALRRAHESVQPAVVQFSMRIGQSRPLFEALEAMRDGSEWENLDSAQRRIVETSIRDAKLSGVGLDGVERERFNEIQLELAELTTRFNNHVLDATKAFALDLEARDQVDGLPESLLELAAQAAREAGHAEASAEGGPWRITLDAPSFVPFMEHSRRRDLRERLYRAYITRASEGDLDNAPLIGRILELRDEEAKLLGFASYAECSLVAKMAPNVVAVETLLEELRAASFEAARRDLEELAEFAREQNAPEADELRHWDLAYWFERLRERRYAFSDEELRPYFPLPRVLDGLFALARRLFGVTIAPADGETSVWHEDVRFFRVFDEAGKAIAAFFLDPYSRPAEKRGGAWMDECVGRSNRLGDPPGSVRLPVAYLVCNQAPPTGGKPSCMSFHEVQTLFHEFGHGLQHMLTKVDYGLAAGIRSVEWDAVELPSQFMENWLYQRETLMGIASHVSSGATLPDDLFEKIVAARTFRSGTLMLRQLYFALTDLELHKRSLGGTSAFEVQRKVAERTTVLAPLDEDRSLCAFSHIFGGGYAAGYYSYKWAEVLSADAFSAFEEAGLDDPSALAETGKRYRDTVLALGGSRSPMEVFVAFRGREPCTDALLRHSGLLEARG